MLHHALRAVICYVDCNIREAFLGPFGLWDGTLQTIHLREPCRFQNFILSRAYLKVLLYMGTNYFTE